MCPYCKTTLDPIEYCMADQEPYKVCVVCGKRFDDDTVINTLPLKETE